MQAKEIITRYFSLQRLLSLSQLEDKELEHSTLREKMSYGFESAPWHWGMIKNCNEKQCLVFLEWRKYTNCLMHACKKNIIPYF